MENNNQIIYKDFKIDSKIVNKIFNSAENTMLLKNSDLDKDIFTRIKD